MGGIEDILAAPKSNKPKLSGDHAPGVVQENAKNSRQSEEFSKLVEAGLWDLALVYLNQNINTEDGSDEAKYWGFKQEYAYFVAQGLDGKDRAGNAVPPEAEIRDWLTGKQAEFAALDKKSSIDRYFLTYDGEAVGEKKDAAKARALWFDNEIKKWYRSGDPGAPAALPYPPLVFTTSFTVQNTLLTGESRVVVTDFGSQLVGNVNQYYLESADPAARAQNLARLHELQILLQSTLNNEGQPYLNPHKPLAQAYDAEILMALLNYKYELNLPKDYARAARETAFNLKTEQTISLTWNELDTERLRQQRSRQSTEAGFYQQIRYASLSKMVGAALRIDTQTVRGQQLLAAVTAMTAETLKQNGIDPREGQALADLKVDTLADLKQSEIGAFFKPDLLDVQALQVVFDYAYLDPEKFPGLEQQVTAWVAGWMAQNLQTETLADPQLRFSWVAGARQVDQVLAALPEAERPPIEADAQMQASYAGEYEYATRFPLASFLQNQLESGVQFSGQDLVTGRMPDRLSAEHILDLVADQQSKALYTVKTQDLLHQTDFHDWLDSLPKDGSVPARSLAYNPATLADMALNLQQVEVATWLNAAGAADSLYFESSEAAKTFALEVIGRVDLAKWKTDVKNNPSGQRDLRRYQDSIAKLKNGQGILTVYDVQFLFEKTTERLGNQRLTLSGLAYDKRNAADAQQLAQEALTQNRWDALFAASASKDLGVEVYNTLQSELGMLAYELALNVFRASDTLDPPLAPETLAALEAIALTQRHNGFDFAKLKALAQKDAVFKGFVEGKLAAEWADYSNGLYLYQNIQAPKSQLFTPAELVEIEGFASDHAGENFTLEDLKANDSVAARALVRQIQMYSAAVAPGQEAWYYVNPSQAPRGVSAPAPGQYALYKRLYMQDRGLDKEYASLRSEREELLEKSRVLYARIAEVTANAQVINPEDGTLRTDIKWQDIKVPNQNELLKLVAEAKASEARFLELEDRIGDLQQLMWTDSLPPDFIEWLLTSQLPDDHTLEAAVTASINADNGEMSWTSLAMNVVGLPFAKAGEFVTAHVSRVAYQDPVNGETVHFDEAVRILREAPNILDQIYPAWRQRGFASLALEPEPGVNFASQKDYESYLRVKAALSFFIQHTAQLDQLGSTVDTLQYYSLKAVTNALTGGYSSVNRPLAFLKIMTLGTTAVLAGNYPEVAPEYLDVTRQDLYETFTVIDLAGLKLVLEGMPALPELRQYAPYIEVLLQDYSQAHKKYAEALRSGVKNPPFESQYFNADGLLKDPDQAIVVAGEMPLSLGEIGKFVKRLMNDHKEQVIEAAADVEARQPWLPEAVTYIMPFLDPAWRAEAGTNISAECSRLWAMDLTDKAAEIFGEMGGAFSNEMLAQTILFRMLMPYQMYIGLPASTVLSAKDAAMGQGDWQDVAKQTGLTALSIAMFPRFAPMWYGAVFDELQQGNVAGALALYYCINMIAAAGGWNSALGRTVAMDKELISIFKTVMPGGARAFQRLQTALETGGHKGVADFLRGVEGKGLMRMAFEQGGWMQRGVEVAHGGKAFTRFLYSGTVQRGLKGVGINPIYLLPSESRLWMLNPRFYADALGVTQPDAVTQEDDKSLPRRQIGDKWSGRAKHVLDFPRNMFDLGSQGVRKAISTTGDSAARVFQSGAVDYALDASLSAADRAALPYGSMRQAAAQFIQAGGTPQGAGSHIYAEYELQVAGGLNTAQSTGVGALRETAVLGALLKTQGAQFASALGSANPQDLRVKVSITTGENQSSQQSLRLRSIVVYDGSEPRVVVPAEQLTHPSSWEATLYIPRSWLQAGSGGAVDAGALYAHLAQVRGDIDTRYAGKPYQDRHVYQSRNPVVQVRIDGVPLELGANAVFSEGQRGYDLSTAEGAEAARQALRALATEYPDSKPRIEIVAINDRSASSYDIVALRNQAIDFGFTDSTVTLPDGREPVETRPVNYSRPQPGAASTDAVAQAWVQVDRVRKTSDGLIDLYRGAGADTATHRFWSDFESGKSVEIHVDGERLTLRGLSEIAGAMRDNAPGSAAYVTAKLELAAWERTAVFFESGQKIRMYDEQILAVLNFSPGGDRGVIQNINTGQGKTVIGLNAAFDKALQIHAGNYTAQNNYGAERPEKVYLLTSNDDLVRQYFEGKDNVHLEKYVRAGLKVGFITAEGAYMYPDTSVKVSKKQIYAECDVIIGASEMISDVGKGDVSPADIRPGVVLFDETDVKLLLEARTNIIISGPAGGQNNALLQAYEWMKNSSVWIQSQQDVDTLKSLYAQGQPVLDRGAKLNAQGYEHLARQLSLAEGTYQADSGVFEAEARQQLRDFLSQARLPAFNAELVFDADQKLSSYGVQQLSVALQKQGHPFAAGQVLTQGQVRLTPAGEAWLQQKRGSQYGREMRQRMENILQAEAICDAFERSLQSGEVDPLLKQYKFTIVDGKIIHESAEGGAQKGMHYGNGLDEAMVMALGRRQILFLENPTFKWGTPSIRVPVPFTQLKVPVLMANWEVLFPEKNITSASISIYDFFNHHAEVHGMSGSAAAMGELFAAVYGDRVLSKHSFEVRVLPPAAPNHEIRVITRPDGSPELQLRFSGSSQWQTVPPDGAGRTALLTEISTRAKAKSNVSGNKFKFRVLGDTGQALVDAFTSEVAASMAQLPADAYGQPMGFALVVEHDTLLTQTQDAQVELAAREAIREAMGQAGAPPKPVLVTTLTIPETDQVFERIKTILVSEYGFTPREAKALLNNATAREIDDVRFMNEVVPKANQVYVTEASLWQWIQQNDAAFAQKHANTIPGRRVLAAYAAEKFEGKVTLNAKHSMGVITVNTRVQRGIDLDPPRLSTAAHAGAAAGNAAVILLGFHEYEALEIQIKGRADRADKPGSFRVIASLEDTNLEAARRDGALSSAQITFLEGQVKASGYTVATLEPGITPERFRYPKKGLMGSGPAINVNVADVPVLVLPRGTERPGSGTAPGRQAAYADLGNPEQPVSPDLIAQRQSAVVDILWNTREQNVSRMASELLGNIYVDFVQRYGLDPQNLRVEHPEYFDAQGRFNPGLLAQEQGRLRAQNWESLLNSPAELVPQLLQVSVDNYLGQLRLGAGDTLTADHVRQLQNQLGKLLNQSCDFSGLQGQSVAEARLALHAAMSTYYDANLKPHINTGRPDMEDPYRAQFKQVRDEAYRQYIKRLEDLSKKRPSAGGGGGYDDALYLSEVDAATRALEARMAEGILRYAFPRFSEQGVGGLWRRHVSAQALELGRSNIHVRPAEFAELAEKGRQQQAAQKARVLAETVAAPVTSQTDHLTVPESNADPAAQRDARIAAVDAQSAPWRSGGDIANALVAVQGSQPGVQRLNAMTQLERVLETLPRDLRQTLRGADGRYDLAKVEVYQRWYLERMDAMALALEDWNGTHPSELDGILQQHKEIIRTQGTVVITRLQANDIPAVERIIRGEAVSPPPTESVSPPSAAIIPEPATAPVPPADEVSRSAAPRVTPFETVVKSADGVPLEHLGCSVQVQGGQVQVLVPRETDARELEALKGVLEKLAADGKIPLLPEGAYIFIENGIPPELVERYLPDFAETHRARNGSVNIMGRAVIKLERQRMAAGAVPPADTPRPAPTPDPVRPVRRRGSSGEGMDFSPGRPDDALQSRPLTTEPPLGLQTVSSSDDQPPAKPFQKGLQRASERVRKNLLTLEAFQQLDPLEQDRIVLETAQAVLQGDKQALQNTIRLLQRGEIRGQTQKAEVITQNEEVTAVTVKASEVSPAVESETPKPAEGVAIKFGDVTLQINPKLVAEAMRLGEASAAYQELRAQVQAKLPPDANVDVFLSIFFENIEQSFMTEQYQQDLLRQVDASPQNLEAFKQNMDAGQKARYDAKVQELSKPLNPQFVAEAGPEKMAELLSQIEMEVLKVLYTEVRLTQIHQQTAAQAQKLFERELEKLSLRPEELTEDARQALVQKAQQAVTKKVLTGHVSALFQTQFSAFVALYGLNASDAEILKGLLKNSRLGSYDAILVLEQVKIQLNSSGGSGLSAIEPLWRQELANRSRVSGQRELQMVRALSTDAKSAVLAEQAAYHSAMADAELSWKAKAGLMIDWYGRGAPGEGFSGTPGVLGYKAGKGALMGLVFEGSLTLLKEAATAMLTDKEWNTAQALGNSGKAGLVGAEHWLLFELKTGAAERFLGMASTGGLLSVMGLDTALAVQAAPDEMKGSTLLGGVTSTASFLGGTHLMSRYGMTRLMQTGLWSRMPLWMRTGSSHALPLLAGMAGAKVGGLAYEHLIEPGITQLFGEDALSNPTTAGVALATSQAMGAGIAMYGVNSLERALARQAFTHMAERGAGLSSRMLLATRLATPVSIIVTGLTYAPDAGAPKAVSLPQEGSSLASIYQGRTIATLNASDEMWQRGLSGQQIHDIGYADEIDALADTPIGYEMARELYAMGYLNALIWEKTPQSSTDIDAINARTDLLNGLRKIFGSLGTDPSQEQMAASYDRYVQLTADVGMGGLLLEGTKHYKHDLVAQGLVSTEDLQGSIQSNLRYLYVQFDPALKGVIDYVRQKQSGLTLEKYPQAEAYTQHIQALISAGILTGSASDYTSGENFAREVAIFEVMQPSFSKELSGIFVAEWQSKQMALDVAEALADLPAYNANQLELLCSSNGVDVVLFKQFWVEACDFGFYASAETYPSAAVEQALSDFKTLQDAVGLKDPQAFLVDGATKLGLRRGQCGAATVFDCVARGMTTSYLREDFSSLSSLGEKEAGRFGRYLLQRFATDALLVQNWETHIGKDTALYMLGNVSHVAPAPDPAELEIMAVQEELYQAGLLSKKGNVTRTGAWDGTVGPKTILAFKALKLLLDSGQMTEAGTAWASEVLASHAKAIDLAPTADEWARLTRWTPEVLNGLPKGEQRTQVWQRIAIVRRAAVDVVSKTGALADATYVKTAMTHPDIQVRLRTLDQLLYTLPPEKAVVLAFSQIQSEAENPYKQVIGYQDHYLAVRVKALAFLAEHQDDMTPEATRVLLVYQADIYQRQSATQARVNSAQRSADATMQATLQPELALLNEAAFLLEMLVAPSAPSTDFTARVGQEISQVIDQPPKPNPAQGLVF